MQSDIPTVALPHMLKMSTILSVIFSTENIMIFSKYRDIHHDTFVPTLDHPACVSADGGHFEHMW